MITSFISRMLQLPATTPSRSIVQTCPIRNSFVMPGERFLNAISTIDPALPAGPFRTDDMAPNVPVEIEPVIASRRVATDLYNVVLSGDGDLASLGIDKQQFISNSLDGPGVANFPGFFGPRQLQTCTELTPETIRYSDIGVACIYSFSATSMTVRIQNLAREAKDKVAFQPPSGERRPYFRDGRRIRADSRPIAPIAYRGRQRQRRFRRWRPRQPQHRWKCNPDADLQIQHIEVIRVCCRLTAVSASIVWMPLER